MVGGPLDALHRVVGAEALPNGVGEDAAQEAHRARRRAPAARDTDDAPALRLGRLGGLAGLHRVQEPAHVRPLTLGDRQRAQQRDDMALDAAAIGDERRFRLRPLALAQHEALLGGGQIVPAEVGHRHGAARGLARRGRVGAVRHLAKGFAGPLARFVGCQHSNRAQASFRVLPAEFRYWTTHVRAPDGFTRRAKPARSSSR